MSTNPLYRLVFRCILLFLVLLLIPKAAFANEQNLTAYQWVMKGIYSYDHKDYDNAILAYSEAITLNPKYAHAYFFRGRIYQHKGQYDLQLADCTKAIELNPQFAEAYLMRGFAYELKGQYELAIADSSKAIELKPKIYEAYMFKAKVYEKNERFDEAVETYELLLKHAPPEESEFIETAKQRIKELAK